MLLACLIAFAVTGLVSHLLLGSRQMVILFLSAGSIAMISPASLFFCLVVAGINFSLLRLASNKGVFTVAIILNILFLLAFHCYTLIYKEYTWAGLPVLLGVSFLALQHIDHLFKVRYKFSSVPNNFLNYLAAVLYLPKFFSGPIAVLPAVAKQIIVPASRPLYSGLNRVLLGLFKKLVLAESLSISVHSVFDFGDAYPGLTFLIAAFLYSFQLYFDFSGYSDIAIGASLLWGISLPENFYLPFRKKSWSEFWKSWHSSLTLWLWQYIFNPLFLSLERKKVNRKIIFLFCSLAVFGAMAFFNGLQSGFYISAGLFALFYTGEQWFSLKKNTLHSAIIFMLFSFALIYFRNPGSEVYGRITQNIFSSNFVPYDLLKDLLAPLASGGTQQDHFNFFFTLLLCLGFILFERKIFALFSKDKINYIAWFVIGVLLLTWGVFGSGERFIYMQF